MRKTATKRRTTRTTRRTRKKKTTPIWLFDAAGISLIFLGLATLVALCAPNSSGVFGEYIVNTLHSAVGVGAWAIWVLLGLMGVMVIVGPLKIVPRNIIIGSGMLFLQIVTWASLRVMTAGLSADTPDGGYIGTALAWVLRKLTGSFISYITLVALGIISIVIIVDVPLAHLIDKIRDFWLDWRDAANERAAELEKKGKDKDKPVKAEKSGKAEDDVEDGRKRTLARIFGMDKGEAPEAEAKGTAAAQAEVKPPVKINMPMAKPERPPKNGGSQPEQAPLFEQGEFMLPPSTLLDEPPPPPARVESELKENIETIERTLEEFKVKANVVEIACGPTVARYEIQLAPGIKVNKIVGLADNLAMQLAAIDVRVEAPIPGKAAIGVEVPNKNRGTVALREMVESQAFREAPGMLSFSLGKDVSGAPLVAELGEKLPHLLIGGSTGSGKSVALNTLIASLLFRATPDELKFVLIDPKRVELSLFDGIPHLACPVIRDVKQASSVLKSVVQEMDKRYMLLMNAGVKKISSYNEKVATADRMPYIVVVVDELADLMIQCQAEVEGSVARLAQLARAVGIHLVIATQRPSVDVITGLIKANISSRMAFAVSSHIDSRTILDQKGAERLIGRGDMLFLPMDASKPVRIQGCYISEREIEALCTFLKEQRRPIFTIQPGQVPGSGGPGDMGELSDELYEPILRYIATQETISTSGLQRKFKIGYTRAARIVEYLEEQGYVGAKEGPKDRPVLITPDDLEKIFGGPIGVRNDGAQDDDYIEEVPPAEIIMPDDDEEDDDEPRSWN